MTFYSLPVTHILLPVTHFTPPSKFWSIQIPIRATVALDVFDKSIVTLSPSEEQEARWRRTEQRAIAAAHPAAPCTSNVLREARCLWLLSLRSFTRDWWQDCQNRAPASTELGAYLQITTTAHACRTGCTRAVAQGSSAAALGAFYSAGLAKYRRLCHVSSCFRPIMQG